MATGKGLLEPKSPVNVQFGRIKKVFIAYVHNPDEYEVYVPPCRPEQLLDPNMLRQAYQEKMDHENAQRQKIKKHTERVKNLAHCLSARGVPVVYEEYWSDTHVTNQLQHFEQQIVDSDYVLLVITPSMNHYLNNVAPVDQEILFTDNFLFNLMTVKKPPGTDFIPVFINSHRDVSLIPTCLASAMSYVLTEPFDCQRGDLCDLYCRFTNQKMIEVVPVSEVIEVARPTTRSAFSIPIGHHTQNDQSHLEMYKILSHKYELITDEKLQYLSINLASQWREIAKHLSLTDREVTDCQMKAGFDSSGGETCYQMLRYWQNRDPSNATVAQLAVGMWNANCGALLKHLL